ncbi:MAG: hypothetical protein MK096_08575 [Oleiphilaceae bacterium]|nr:hypothetical protein [Oleiphilaceae bacterium]
MRSLILSRTAHTRVGLEFRTDGLAIALTRSARYPSLKLMESYWLPSAPNKRLQNLRNFVREQGLKGVSCDIVLPRNDYQRIELDAPNVPETELESAVHWAVQALMDDAGMDAQVEYFDYPKEALRNRPPRLHARVARQALIDTLTQSAIAVGLKPKRITVSDLALKNLSETIEPSNELQLTLKCENDFGLITIHKSSQLYFSRDFAISRRATLSADEEMAQVAIEVQRSIDFFEGQTGLALPRQIRLLSSFSESDRVALEMLLGSAVIRLPLQSKLKAVDAYTDTSGDALLKTQNAVAVLCASNSEANA